MTLGVAQIGNEKKAFETFLSFTYRWFNRLAWPFEAAISGFVAYWSFSLPEPSFAVQVGGAVFAIFAAICAVNAVLWWSNNARDPTSSR